MTTTIGHLEQHSDDVFNSSDPGNCAAVCPEQMQSASAGPSEHALLSEYADDPEMAEILGQFLDELPGQIAAMVHARAVAKLDELGRLAHQLKGAGGSYGFPQLSEAASALEMAVRRGDSDGTNPPLGALVALGRRIAQSRRAAPAPDHARAMPDVSPVAKILLVDDSRVMLDFLAFQLRQQGYQSVMAHSGEEALHLVATEAPDLILMDVTMPGMGGLKACRRLKIDPEHSRIPVILITSCDTDQDIADGLDAGADDYIAKPCNPTVIAARVRAALRGKAAADRLRDANQKLKDEILLRQQTQRALSEAEDQLRQTQKLEAVGCLAGGVAHEFNNLLQVIDGYTKYAMKGLAPADRRCRDLQAVLDATQRASKLTRQLLGFGRRKPLECISVPLNELVCDTVKLAQMAVGPDIDVQTELDEDVGTVLADPGELQQALLSLCLNSRDAMPGGGRLLLKTETVVVDDTISVLSGQISAGRYAAIHVTDNGCGMSEEVKQRLFEPFFTTKEVGKGTGLGLANVHGVVRQHQGAIIVASQPGQGTTVKIFLRQETQHFAGPLPCEADGDACLGTPLDVWDTLTL